MTSLKHLVPALAVGALVLTGCSSTETPTTTATDASGAPAVALVQGSWTVVGYFAGDVLSVAQVDALSAAGGVILLALGLRLLNVKQIPVGDLLPALFLAPALVPLAAVFA